MTSDEKLAVLRPALVGLGYDVEGGKKAADKLRRPVLFGEQGTEDRAFEVDAFHGKAKTLRRFRRTLRAAGVDDSHTLHDLRHTFGTRMAAGGVPMRTLQEWMGHRHITTTERYADYAPSIHERNLIEAASVRSALNLPSISPNLSASQSMSPTL